MTPPYVTAAEARAAAARQRLTATIATLKARIAPKALAQEAAQSVIARGQTIAQDAADTAKRYPLPLGGAIAALGLFLARKPIARLFTRRTPDATLIPPASLTINRAAKRK